MSTANVPCQQMDWWREHIEQLGTGLDRLPAELQGAVFDEVTGVSKFPFTPDEAEDLRLVLMKERMEIFTRQELEFEEFEPQIYTYLDH